MADGANRDTTLTIRVKDLGTKTFKEVASSVDSITNALDRQIVAAERGEVSIGSLKDTISKLKSANADLVKQQAAVDQYEKLAAALAGAETKANEAKAAFDTMALAQQKSGNASKEQQSALAKLETAATRAEAGVLKATQKLDEQRAKLQELGLDTNNLAQAQHGLASTNAQIEASLAAVTSAYENYDANIKRTKEAEQALAAAQQQAAAAANASTRRQDLAFQQQLAEGLQQQTAAQEALTAAEERAAAVERARNQRGDLLFQTQLEQAIQAQTAAQERLAATSRTSAFQQTGTDAIDAANKIDVYAAAASRAAPASARLAASLDAILNPSKAIVSTLGGLESEINRVTAVIGDGKGSVHSYGDAFTDLDRIQRQTLKTAGTVDAYRDQAKAVHAAQLAFQNAKQDVLNYGRAIETSAEPNDALAASLKNAQAALASTEASLTGEIVKLKELGKALKTAGVDINDLGAAEKRLSTIATQTAAATNKLQDAASGKNGKIGSFLGLRPYELQNLSFQLNDVFTQIASGTSVTQTFAQQGGQIAQLFPKFFAGLIPLAPVILGVGGALALMYASLKQIFDLEASQRQFAADMILSADGTREQAAALAETAHELDVYGGSLKDVRAELETFLEKGLDPSRIQQFGVAAQDLADVTGKKLPAAAEALTTAFSGGMEAIDKLDEQYHFLTVTQRDSIKLAFDEGRAADARGLAFDTFRGKIHDAAQESRDNWQTSVRDLSAQWDGFLHTIGNLLPIHEAAETLAGLTKLIRELTSALPKAKEAQANAQGKTAEQAATEAKASRPSVLSLTDTLTNPLGVAITALRALGRKQQAEAKKQTDAIAGEAAKATDTLKSTGDAATNTNNKILEGLREQYVDTQSLTDAEKIRLRGLKAMRDAEKQGATGNALAQARQIGEEQARQEVARDNARKKEQADRKAAAAARKAEAEANRKLQLQQDAINQLRSANIANNNSDVQSLEARLDAVRDKYAKIFDTIDKLNKNGIKDVKGVPLDQFTQQVKDSQTVAEHLATQQFYTDQIANLEKERAARLDAIKDKVAAGNETAQQGYQEAQGVAADLNKQINEAAATALEFAQSIRGATPDPKLEAFISRMEQLAAGTGPNANRTNSPVAQLGKSLIDQQKTQLDALIAARDKIVQNEKNLLDLGLETADGAQAKIRQAYADTTDQIRIQAQAILDLAQKQVQAGTMSQQAFQGLVGEMQLVVGQTQYLDENFVKLHDTIINSITTGVSQAFDTVTTAIGAAIDGTGSWEDALNSLGQAALQFGASFLKAIADILLQIAVLQAIKNIPFLNGMTQGIMDFTGLAAGAAALAAPAAALNTGSVALGTGAAALAAPATMLNTAGLALGGAATTLPVAGGSILAGAQALAAAAAALQTAATTLLIANAASAGVAHSGAVVGPGGVGNRTRSVSPTIFAGAPRYHSGTVVGLKPDEQAAILQNGEEVLSKSDPRNILNGGKNKGKGGGAAGAGPIQVKVVNAIDSGDFVSAGLDTPHGEQAVMNFMRSRASAIKAMLQR